MAFIKKPKNYRKKKVESDDEAEATTEHTSNQDNEEVSSTIEELTELRKLRRKHGGIDAEKLLSGAEKRKKKKKTTDDPNQWNLKTGGLVDPEAYRQKMDEDESANKSKKLKLDSFATATNRLDVDKHMMEYIENEMKKRRGGKYDAEEEEDGKRKDRGLVDIYEELYRIPDRLKGDQKQASEGNVQLSTQMLTAIPEVDLGIDTRLRNIEDTEKAKRKLIDETRREEENESKSYEDDVPANFEKQIPKQFKPILGHKLKSTDDQAVANFKKRLRK